MLNPSGVALAVFGLLAWTGHGNWSTAGIGAFCFALLPGAILGYMRASGRIDQLYPDRRQQRSGLLLLGAACYFLGSGALRLAGAAPFMQAAGLVFGINALLVWGINRYWKISIHSVGVSGGVTILLAVLGQAASPGLILLPLIAWARWHLCAHTPAQIAAGLLLGAGSTWGLYAFF